MTPADTPPDSIGSRIRRFRSDQGISLSGLARASGISKGYLWTLENPPEGEHSQRPSGQTLYAIAKALGVTMSDLLGERLILEQDATVDPTLQQFAEADGLSQADIQMLASIQWRGSKPKTVERWRYIYQAIVTSRSLDGDS